MKNIEENRMKHRRICTILNWVALCILLVAGVVTFNGYSATYATEPGADARWLGFFTACSFVCIGLVGLSGLIYLRGQASTMRQKRTARDGRHGSSPQ